MANRIAITQAADATLGDNSARQFIPIAETIGKETFPRKTNVLALRDFITGGNQFNTFSQAAVFYPTSSAVNDVTIRAGQTPADVAIPTLITFDPTRDRTIRGDPGFFRDAGDNIILPAGGVYEIQWELAATFRHDRDTSDTIFQMSCGGFVGEPLPVATGRTAQIFRTTADGVPLSFGGGSIINFAATNEGVTIFARVDIASGTASADDALGQWTQFIPPNAPGNFMTIIRLSDIPPPPTEK